MLRNSVCFETEYDKYNEKVETYHHSILPSYGTEGQKQLGEAIVYSCKSVRKEATTLKNLKTFGERASFLADVAKFVADRDI